MTVLALPAEVVALVGKACDSKTRNACRLAHSHFRNVHEDVDVHQITISTTEGCKERLETALRLKPRLKDFKVFVKGVKEGEVDLSPLQQGVEHVEVHVEGCCSGSEGLRLTGVSGKHAYVTFEASATMSPGMLAFLMQQAHVNINMCMAQSAAVLANAALLAKVDTLIVNTRDEADRPPDVTLDFSLARVCDSVVLGVSHNRVHVTGVDAITELYFDHSQWWYADFVRAWLNETSLGAHTNPRLKWVMCYNVPWGLQQLTGDTLVEHLVTLVHAKVPSARICMDALYPHALQFVLERVPRDANFCLLCMRLTGEKAHDTYVAARLAQILLKAKGRDVPMHHRWLYEPPAELKGRTSIQELYDGFQSAVSKQWWHWLTFLPA